MSSAAWTLGRLLDYDGENDADLLATLKLLLETNFNYMTTAAELFAHADTVRVREIFVDMHILPSGYVENVSSAREKIHSGEEAISH